MPQFTQDTMYTVDNFFKHLSFDAAGHTGYLLNLIFSENTFNYHVTAVILTLVHGY